MKKYFLSINYNNKKATEIDQLMPTNEKNIMIGIIWIQLAFFKKLIKVERLTGNNIKPNNDDCFLATPQPSDYTTGIPGSDYHIYVTYKSRD